MKQRRFELDPPRVKIEYLPAIVNVPFIAIIIYVLVENSSYWPMFNEILGGVFHLGGLPYVEMLFGMAIGFGVFTIGFGITGIFKLQILHKPFLNVMPTIMLGFMAVLVIVLLNVNVRANLDYLFFMLGPERGFYVYVGASLGIFVLVLLLVVGLKQLHVLKPDDRGLIDGKELHPRVAFWTTLVSATIGFSMIMAIGFYYPTTTIYWNNIVGIHARYVDWTSTEVLSLVVAGTVAIGLGTLFLAKQRLPDVIKSRLTRTTFYLLTIIIAGISCLCLAWFSVVFEQSMVPALPGLWIYPATTLGLFALACFIPLMVALRVALPPVSTHQDRLKRLVMSPRLQNVIVFAVIATILFMPFWFVFYQPIATGPPNIDVPFQTRVVDLNGIPVPFNEDTVYPGFEMQSNETRVFLNMSGQWRMQRLNISDGNTLAPRTAKFIEKIATGQHGLAHDDSGWELVDLPSPVSHFEDAVHSWGVTWYRRLVTVPASFANKTILFKLLGVNYFCDVWVDGTHIGYHEGGFTSFAFDLSSLLDPGTHLFAIRVDNPEWDIKNIFYYTTQPNGGDFFNYGGITRELYLEASPLASVSRVDARQVGFSTSNHVNGSVELEIDVTWKCVPQGVVHGDAGTLDIGIYPLSFGNESALRSRETWRFARTSTPAFTASFPVSLLGMAGTGYASLRCNASVPLVFYWSTKQPSLYAVMVNLTAGDMFDRYCTQTGFRNITVDGEELRLNGAPLKLAGVSCHEQYPAPFGRSLTDEQRFWDLTCINETRSNWWRGSYPFHPMMYVYSDRFGIACWEESQVFWCNEPDMIAGLVRGTFKSMWVEMLYRDYNRPSILMWSAGNEPWAYEAFLTYLRQTKAFLDAHDPNRILSFACVSSQDWTRFFRETPLRVVTPNCYGGTFEGEKYAWYEEITANLQRYGNNNPGKPILNMEWGYWRGEGKNQSKCFLDGFRAFTENPRVQGFTWWIAFDYWGPNYYNSMGVYNMNRTWHEQDTFDAMVANFSAYTSTNL